MKSCPRARERGDTDASRPASAAIAAKDPRSSGAVARGLAVDLRDVGKRFGGAGKKTLMRATANLLPAERGIFEALTRLGRDEGLSLLIAEQNRVVARRYAHRAIGLSGGRTLPIDADADADGLYLGVAARSEARSWTRPEL